MENSPFGDSQPKDGFGRFGWIATPGIRGEETSVSFGRVFGYESEFALLVWDKLHEHFNGASFPNGWYDEEQAERSKEEDFLLEFDIDFKIQNEKNNYNTFTRSSSSISNGTNKKGHP